MAYDQLKAFLEAVKDDAGLQKSSQTQQIPKPSQR
mgnify:CR=1 FL=1